MSEQTEAREALIDTLAANADAQLDAAFVEALTAAREYRPVDDRRAVGVMADAILAAGWRPPAPDAISHPERRPGCECFMWDEDCPNFGKTLPAPSEDAREVLASLIEREYDRADPLNEGMRPSGRALADVILASCPTPPEDVAAVVDALREHARSWTVKTGKWNHDRGDLLNRAADLLAARSAK